MLQNWVVVVIALGYIGSLFVIASYGDRFRAFRHSQRRMLIYPLSLAIYCTSWTFFGSVGLASRTGLEFLAIYLGPIIMVGLCTPLLRRIVQLAKTHNITSIADFIAARYGKSQAVAATVALIAIIGSVPYIALQLKAVASSLETVMAPGATTGGEQLPLIGDLALVVALTMAAFAILFGTRHTDATEHQDGLILAVAAESIVKLFAFLAAGIFVTFWMFDGPWDLLASALNNTQARHAIDQPLPIANFLAMTLLAFFAIILLPRQFHVSVVENYDQAEIARARWVFPLYLVAINLFVVPIALAGIVTFPAASNGDMFVLALPLAGGSPTITIITFIGGLSAATAMVIVESVALAIMVSNDLIVPLALRRGAGKLADHVNVGGLLLKIRRVAIVAIMLLAYLYYRVSGSAQLASIGLLSFAAVAQFAPAFFGGLVWRQANARGAIAGMAIGFVAWVYMLLLPSFADSGFLSATLLSQGPFGIAALRPQAFLGIDLPPLVHGVVWSLGLNIAAYIAFSLMRAPSSIERLQADAFVPSQLTPISPNFRLWRSSVTVQDLLAMTSQYLGPQRAQSSFQTFAQERGIALDPAAPADFQLFRHAEHQIASVIGAASSRVVLSLLLRRRTVSAKAALKLLDDAQATLQYNREILQTALNHVSEAIAVFDRELHLVCYNRQFGEILGLPAAMSQIGVRLEDILSTLSTRNAMPDEDMDYFVRQRVAAYTHAEEPFLERFPQLNRVVEVRPNRMPDGGRVFTFTDITASVESAEALERANATLENRVRERTEQLTRLNSELARAKGAAEDANLSKTRFLAAASHDILQPLNAARLYVTSLVERHNAGDEARLARNIDDSLEAIEEIFGVLLDISRLDAGAMMPTVTNVAVGDLLRALDVEFAPMAREKGLKLTFMPCSLTVRSDRALLRRMLQNLVSNAIKYTTQGRVLVGCRRQGDTLRFDIYDTGVGIPPSKRVEIFKEFHRLDHGAKIARGLGLGLSIVERLSRVLNHAVIVESDGATGSHFSVLAPLAEGVVTPVAAAPAPRPPQKSLQGKLIACIDNDPAILDGMRTLLEGWGARVIGALDPASAMDEINEAGERPLGLLVDYHLDRGNGIAAIRDVRRVFGATMPAVLITADRSPHVREVAAREGVLVLHKPVKPAALRAILSQWRAPDVVAAE